MATEDPREAAIRGLHVYKEQLLVEIERKQADLKSVERSIELLSGDNPETGALKKTELLFVASETPASRYSELGNQAAVELFLQENAGHWFRASVVVKELMRRGMKPTGKFWAPAITGALNRANKKGLAEKMKRNGVFVYRYAIEKEQGE